MFLICAHVQCPFRVGGEKQSGSYSSQKSVQRLLYESFIQMSDWKKLQCGYLLEAHVLFKSQYIACYNSKFYLAFPQ